MMKKISLVIFVAVIICVFVSCGKQKNTNEIITRKPVAAKSETVSKMGDYAQSCNVEWVGASYKVKTKFMADTSLPIVKDGTHRYYDNKIQLQVLRKDGSVFFDKTYTKSDFTSCLDDKFKTNGALLGIVYNYTKGDYMYFAASVGSPDTTSDDYLPLVLKLSKMGEVSIYKDDQLDTSSDVPAEDEAAEDEEGI